MVLGIVLFSVVLVAVLARVCVLSARAIRRDVDERFRRIEARLEEEANAVVDQIFGGKEGSG